MNPKLENPRLLREVDGDSDSDIRGGVAVCALVCYRGDIHNRVDNRRCAADGDDSAPADGICRNVGGEVMPRPKIKFGVENNPIPGETPAVFAARLLEYQGNRHNAIQVIADSPRVINGIMGFNLFADRAMMAVQQQTKRRRVISGSDYVRQVRRINAAQQRGALL